MLKATSHIQTWHVDFQGNYKKYFESFEYLGMTNLSVLHFPMGGSLTYLQCDVESNIALYIVL